MKKRLSLLILVIVAIADFSASFLYYPKWKNTGTEAAISWDASGYYMYLPAIFIYKDLKKCDFRDDILQKYNPTPDFQQAFQHPSGNWVMKYSCGQAIILSPAFFMAHLYTQASQIYPADGFSLPYQFSIVVWCLLLSLIGLFLLRKLLLYYFDDKTVAITLLSIALCSNYFEYANFEGAMTHNTLFTLYVILILITKQFYEKPTFLLAALIGILCGLATLTRPTEIISILIPTVWGIYSFETLKKKIEFFKKQFSKLLLAVSAFSLIVSLQLFYWKWATGEWIVYSYQEQGFDWFHPHIIQCLFSVKAGWLLYSPIFIFSIIGFYFLYKTKPFLFWVSLSFIIPFTYLCFSWSEWWYGWSLGQRAMIQSYPILAFPMAAFYSWMSKGKIIKRLCIGFIFLCLIYNIWLTHQSHKGGLLKGPEMNTAYFMAIFGRLNVDEYVFTLLDNKDYIKPPYKTELIYQNDFNSDTSANAIYADTLQFNKQIVLNQSIQFSTEYFLNEDFKKDDWYKISADFTSDIKEWDTWKMCQFIVKFYDGEKEVKSNIIRVFRLLDYKQTKTIHLFAKAPASNFSNISILFYNAQSDKEILVDNLKVETVQLPDKIFTH